MSITSNSAYGREQAWGLLTEWTRSESLRKRGRWPGHQNRLEP